MSIVTLLVYLMDNLHRNSLGELESRHEARVDRHLTYSGLILTLVMQTRDPWDITNTFVPILVYILIFIFRVTARAPRLNAQMFRRGALLMGLAFVFFVCGLNRSFDFLRIWHGLWHMTASVSLFYLMQCVDKDKPDPKLQLSRLEKMERFSYWQVCSYMYTLQFLCNRPIKV
jgi:hypothetical protein